MTRKNTGKSNKPGDPATALNFEAKPDESEGEALAKVGLNPAANAMGTARLFAKGSFGDLSVTGMFQALLDEIDLVKTGDLSSQRAMLAAQSFALNSIFTELSRRSARNMGEYIEASERYMRLALKAQSQCRATIEALDRLANGREQTVRHVHVDNRGGQAVIAENVQTGGKGNGKIDDQSRATGAAGSGPALLGTDPFGNGVPISSREREAAVQDARRE